MHLETSPSEPSESHKYDSTDSMHHQILGISSFSKRSNVQKKGTYGQLQYTRMMVWQFSMGVVYLCCHWGRRWGLWVLFTLTPINQQNKSDFWNTLFTGCILAVKSASLIKTSKMKWVTTHLHHLIQKNLLHCHCHS